ncbi:hypothetical protein G7048_26225 (plasmid) [Diaphorobacter sp. HDW4B]|uniref:WD40/YVTN/BNR-like repeat-containing protein n=1 Tax=Diaphorobacter sp. HDW4B TaxID=2714925 RepID=UPI00140A814E|nr:YCF48-related protein [Diaphorobacter sp. HDW4B]QIL73990.1 hypothetical protein G7048_26225 [Diaphorobacter sp. HDW4B]
MSKSVLAARRGLVVKAGLFGAAWLLGAARAATGAGANASNAFRAPSDTAAAIGATAAHGPFLAIAQAGKRLVAAGLRGRIAYSDDEGKTWQQARVPVEVDLVALSFPTASEGWAVGHRGVVLTTQDAGATWKRRFAEQQLNELIVNHYKAAGAAADSAGARAAAGAARSIEDGSTPSLLDVWFESPTTGYVVGTFNLIFRTDDAGKTWVPTMEAVDNPEELHFYAVRGQGNGLYMTGEKGSVWHFDAAQKRWAAVPTGYVGTLFGLVADGLRVLAYGMRGRIYASEDAGQHWQVVSSPAKAGIVAGVRLQGGEIVLADQSGELLQSKDAGRSFAALNAKSRVAAFSLLQSGTGQLFAAGPGGVARVAMNAS